MNSNVLSQDEVDALLQGITGEPQKVEEEKVEVGKIRDYDPSKQERIVRGRMPTMELVSERFARNIRVGLFKMMRRAAEVTVAAIKVQKYSAFLREIVVPTNFNVMAVKPLRGHGLLIVDPTLVFAVIDAMYGGVGKYHTRIEGRDFSPTEMRVIRRLVDTLSEEFTAAWKGIFPIELEYQRSEMQPQFANIATGSEVVMVTSYNFEVAEATGMVHICIPYATMEPIRDILYSTMQSDVVDPDRRWIKLLRSEIQSAEVDLCAELARTPMTMNELMHLKPGDFIELDLAPRIKAKVDGVPVFDCHYGTSNGRYAIKIDRSLAVDQNGWMNIQPQGGGNT